MTAHAIGSTIIDTAMPAQNALPTYRVVSHSAAFGSVSGTWKNGIQPRLRCSQRANSAACGMIRKKPHRP